MKKDFLKLLQVPARLLSGTIVSLLLLLFLGACVSTMPETIPEGTSPSAFFQNGQEAATEERYDDAIRWYSTFIERYPEMAGQIVEAEYEIAFLHYKKGDTAGAVDLFEALLEKYRSDEAAAWAQWPRVLAAKLIDQIEGLEE